MIIFYNQQFINQNSANIAINNRSFRFGDGVFETIKLDENFIPLHIDKHILRMFESLKCLKIKFESHFNYTEHFIGVIKQLCVLNNFNNNLNLAARILAYRNSQSIGYLPVGESNAEFIVEIFEINPKLNNNKVIVSSYTRQFSQSLPIFSKTANSLQFVMAKLQANENNCFDSIMLNDKQYICEFSSGNIFWQIKDNQNNDIFYTPSPQNGIVKGIMRQIFIDKLKNDNKIIHEGSFTLNDLQKAHKIYFTNATLGIVEVELLSSNKS